MPEIHTSIDIDAPPEAVWAVLTDVESYPEWNPHLTRVEGTFAEGETLGLWVAQSGRENYIDVRVVECDAPRRVEWVGRVGAKFLFEGTHTFELEPLDGEDGVVEHGETTKEAGSGGTHERTRLHNDESSRGLLVPLVVKKDARSAYEAMNEALKTQVERGQVVEEAGAEA